MATENPKPNNDGLEDEGKPKGGDPTPPKDQKPEGDTGDPKPKNEPKDDRTVPESYDLKLPKDSLIDESRIKEVADFAKSHKLTNDEAQAILERENAFKAAIIDGQQEELAATREKWIEDAKADSEIGGEKFDENIELAKRVVGKYGTPTLKKYLNETGLGDNPEVIRFMARIGKASKDDEFIHAGAAPAAGRSMEDVFYGDSKNKNKE